MKKFLKNAPIDFVMALALNFRLSESDLHFLGCDIEYADFLNNGFLKPGILKNESITDTTIKFLMYEKKDEAGLLDANNFLEDYLKATNEERQQMYNDLYDIDIKYAKLLKKTDKKYNIEDYIVATNYRYKYGLSAEAISMQLGENRCLLNHAELKYKDELEKDNITFENKIDIEDAIDKKDKLDDYYKAIMSSKIRNKYAK